jgi:hypothetical protein
MAISINHFSLGARNIYESAARLNKETGFGFWTGEWVQTTACHMFPLGKDVFIEVEGTIDAHAYLAMPKPNYTYDALDVDNEYNGDHWTGLMLGVESLAELEAVAKRLGGEVSPDDSKVNPYSHFRRPDGYTMGYQSAPRFPGARPDKWPRGLPSFYYYPDVPGRSSNQPVIARPHLVTATGVKWIEFGGTEALLSEWMGVPKASDVIPVKFNGKEVGLWAVCVGREGMDDVVIRRPTAAASIKDPSIYKDVPRPRTS